MTTMAASQRSFWSRHVRPQTRLGRVAGWLALGFLAWFIFNQSIVVRDLPLEGAQRLGLIALGLSGLALGLVAGVVAVVAIVRRHERGALVFLAALPGVMVVAFVLGELLVPH